MATLTRSGYVLVRCPDHPVARKDGYALEHRKVAYDAGLLTDPTMHVHHRNGNRADNRLDNLEVITQADHNRTHHIERGTVTNKAGTFPLAKTADERADRRRESMRRVDAKRGRVRKGVAR